MKSAFISLLVLLTISKIVSSLSSELYTCNNQSTENDICKVDENYRPFLPPSYPTNITLLMNLREVLEINEKSQSMTILLQFSMMWPDPRLRTSNLTNKDQIITNINHQMKNVWIPELFFSNSARIEKVKGVKDNSLKFLLYASASWTELFDHESLLLTDVIVSNFICSMNFINFPFDQQSCLWTIRAADLTVDYVHLEPPWLSLSHGQQTAEFHGDNSITFSRSGLQFEVTVTPLETIEEKFQTDIKFSLARLRMDLKRKDSILNYLIISYYFPTGAFSLISLLSFCMKHETVSFLVILYSFQISKSLLVFPM